MGTRTLDVTVISAKDVKDVNFISKMDVYVVVSLYGDSKQQKAKSHVNHDGGSNPTWNFPVRFTIDDFLAQENRVSLVFNLKSERTLGDKDIGEVVVPVKELLDSPGDGNSPRFLSYKVVTPSGRPKGQIHFSYKFGDVVPAATAPGFTSVKANESVKSYPGAVAGSSSAPYAATPAAGYAYAYPPPPQEENMTYAYPPPPQEEKVAYAYPPPPQYGGYPPPLNGGYPPPQNGGYPPQAYGYPPPPAGYGAYPAQGGYGYPPMQQKPPKKSKFGLGMGAGLMGGMLGGLLIGDMISDAADYDMDMDMDGGFDF